MFDISFWELAVVGIVALLVVGPEKLPVLVRDVSRWAKKIRRIVTETRYELEREFDFEEERRKFRGETKKLQSAIDELDDLMEIAPDRDPDNNKQNPTG
jgi:sec-independent protein translocase protein TatB